MNANSVAQLMMGRIGGENHYMSNIVRLPNPATNGSVTPTKNLIEERIQQALRALGVKNDDPYELQALEPTGDEFAAGSTIHIEAAAEQVLDMQEAIDDKVASENDFHDDSGRAGYGIDPSLPCRLVDHAPARTR